jgi:hypothetical protein
MLQITQWNYRSERQLWFGGLAVLALAALPLAADTIAGDFSGQTPPYETATGNAWGVGGPGLSETAVGFTVSSSYSLSQIEVVDNFAVADLNATPSNNLNDLVVSLWESPTDLNNASATQLESWDVSPPTPGAAELFTLSPSSSTTPGFTPTFTSGENYFIVESVLSDGPSTAEWGWEENNLTPLLIGYYGGTLGSPGSFSILDNLCTDLPCTATNDPTASGTPAYSVSGTPATISTVPEPSSYAVLLAAGFVGLLIMRRRRSAVQ